MGSKSKKKEESSSGTEQDESREINPGPDESSVEETSEQKGSSIDNSDYDKNIELQDLNAGQKEDFSDDSSDEDTHAAKLQDRRKSMKINTIGLDISEVRKSQTSPEGPSALSNQIEIDTKGGKAPVVAISDYSSGDSEEGFHVPYHKLPKKEKDERIFYLWMQAFRKAKGASVIVRKHIYLNSHIYTQGYINEKNVKYHATEQA